MARSCACVCVCVYVLLKETVSTTGNSGILFASWTHCSADYSPFNSPTHTHTREHAHTRPHVPSVSIWLCSTDRLYANGWHWFWFPPTISEQGRLSRRSLHLNCDCVSLSLELQNGLHPLYSDASLVIIYSSRQSHASCHICILKITTVVQVRGGKFVLVSFFPPSGHFGH